MSQKLRQFKKLNLSGRYRHIRDHGEYIDSRFFGTYKVHLYEVEGFYAEVWMRPDLDQVCWIEIADTDNVAENYTKSIDIKSDLGL
ncbi:MAG: hypothetical protein ACI8QH_001065 [Flammeovirgaceae bacterium]